MEKVKNMIDIVNNIKTLEKYLASKNPTYKNYAYDRVKKGRCFFVYKVNNDLHFAPSRFLGYQNNTMEKHDVNDLKDGKETNPAINQIVGHKLFFDNKLEDCFVNYCGRLGIIPSNVKRTFWEPKNSRGENIDITIQ